jgi:methyl-accepting chemotaxis protein
MKLSDIRIGTRLALAFGCIVALMLAMTAFGALRISRIIDINRLIAERSERYSLAAQWKADTRLNLTRTQAIAKSGNQAALAAYLKPQIADTSARISELQKRLAAMVVSGADKAQLAAIGQRRAEYVAIRDGVFAQMQGGDVAGAMIRVDHEMNAAATVYLDSIETLERALLADLKTDSPKLQADAQATRAWLLGLTATAALTAGAAAWLITHSITRPMRQAIEAARRVAGGDLSQALHTDRGDELGELQRALADMQQRLSALVLRIRAATESVSTASTQIAAGSLDLSGRTEQTASNLQQTAASMEQLASTVKQTADSARAVNELASSASSVASRGGHAVAQVVSTMDQISASSRKVADIIAVIDDIAFQTNILALNAAVESARAGEQGRGFAVVAGEVRGLARRSAEAAHEIKRLIETSVANVETGNRLVGDAGATMSEIVAGVRGVTQMIQEITTAAREQSQGLDQINSAVSHLEQMTQQNAALVEQSSAASESLKRQALDLADAVSAFRVGAEAPAA